MRFAISHSQHQILQDNGFVELEGLLSQGECAVLSEVIAAEMQRRCPQKKKKTPFQEYLMAGRDVRVDLSEIEKIARNPHFAECASHLFRARPLRLVYDQVLVSRLNEPFPRGSFLQLSSVQDFMGVLLLAVSGTIGDLTSPFPKSVGNGTFVDAQTLLDFSVLSQEEAYTCLVIAFAKGNAVYSPRSSDPHKYRLQEQGYSIGDRLKEPLHPIVYI